MKKYKLYINGEWIDSTSDDYIKVENPATQEIIAEVPAASKEDILKAIKSAKDSLISWRILPKSKRIEYVEKMVEYFNIHKEEMAMTVLKELGAPIKKALSVHIMPYIDNALDYIRLAKSFSEIDYFDGYEVHKEPVGVVAAITPWNFPFGQIEKKLIPALLMGNTVILKPSQQAPLSAYYVAKACEYANLPKGVFSLITGRGAEVGDVLAKHNDVNMISFTGSTTGGVEVASLGLETMKRYSLELGGKSAAIILDSADYKKAAIDSIEGTFPNTGQACSSKTRILIPRKDKDVIEKYLIEAASKYVTGDPLDENVDMGPLSSKKQYDKVTSYIELGKKNFKVLFEGESIKGGYYVNPIIFTDVDNKHKIAQDEIFGPVICVIYYDTIDEAIEIANDSIYGLHGMVFGDEETSRYVASRVNTGQLQINGAKRTHNAPFGGYKLSGIGREGGIYGMEEYIEYKTLII